MIDRTVKESQPQFISEIESGDAYLPMQRLPRPTGIKQRRMPALEQLPHAPPRRRHGAEQPRAVAGRGVGLALALVLAAHDARVRQAPQEHVLLPEHLVDQEPDLQAQEHVVPDEHDRVAGGDVRKRLDPRAFRRGGEEHRTCELFEQSASQGTTTQSTNGFQPLRSSSHWKRK